MARRNRRWTSKARSVPTSRRELGRRSPSEIYVRILADLTFSWEGTGTPQTIRDRAHLTSYRDADAEDEKFIVSSRLLPRDTHPKVKFIVDDSQTQTFVLTLPFSNVNVIDEGATHRSCDRR